MIDPWKLHRARSLERVDGKREWSDDLWFLAFENGRSDDEYAHSVALLLSLGGGIDALDTCSSSLSFLGKLDRRTVRRTKAAIALTWPDARR